MPFSPAFTRTTSFLLRQARPAPSNLCKPLFKPITSRTFAMTLSDAGGVHNIGSKAEFNQVLKDNDLVVVDFFATWCGPCKVIAPQVVQMSNDEKYLNKARFLKVDVDQIPDLAQEYSVTAMPTFMVFKKGEKVQDVVGANVKALENAVSSNL